MRVSEVHGYLVAEPPRFEGTAEGEFVWELLRGLVHKQNNLTGVVVGFADLVRMTDGLDATAKRNLGEILVAARRAKVLAEVLLPAGGCGRVVVQRVNLGELLPAQEGGWAAQAQAGGATLRVTVAAGVPAVSADPVQLREVIGELVRNGVEAIAESRVPGMVAVDVVAPGVLPESRAGAVDILVRNTGPVIAAERLGEVFTPFKGTKDSAHFGLGLTTAAMALGKMGATIGVKSGGGATTFWVSVPVAG